MIASTKEIPYFYRIGGDVEPSKGEECLREVELSRLVKFQNRI